MLHTHRTPDRPAAARRVLTRPLVAALLAVVPLAASPLASADELTPRPGATLADDAGTDPARSADEPLGGSGAKVSGSGASTGVTCAGREPTITGTPGHDVTGSPQDDVIVAVGPGIEVWANGGDDLVCVFSPTGHGGYNTVHLGPGDDTVFTLGAANDVFGHDGHDRAYLNGTSEWAEMGDGDDTVWALGAESVMAEGGDGWDVLVGSPGADHLFGGAGYDVAIGADGEDVLAGDEGNDLLLGGAGWDLLDGGDHFDECRDHQGADGADTVSCETVVLSPAAALPEAG